MADFLGSAGDVLWLHSCQVTVVVAIVAVLCGTVLRRRRHLGYALLEIGVQNGPTSGS